MSISHQRRQGEGTVDGQTLDWAKRSDLYKMAKEFAPNVNLIPITKSWEIGINENPVNDLSLGGLYFGKWILNHNSQDVGDSDNSRKRSHAFLKYGNDVVARTMLIVHGDDILAWGTKTTHHYGFASSLHVYKLEDDDQPQHGVQVSFIGYKISNDPNFAFPPPLVVLNPNQNGNVGLTAQDLTNAGYTYQWNVTTGVGVFTDPNNPTTSFVPDGNGNYVLQLVVTDGDGVVSAPVEIPVEVDFRTYEYRVSTNAPVSIRLGGVWKDYIADEVFSKFYSDDLAVNIQHPGATYDKFWEWDLINPDLVYDKIYAYGIGNTTPFYGSVKQANFRLVPMDNGNTILNETGLQIDIDFQSSDSRVAFYHGVAKKFYYERYFEMGKAAAWKLQRFDGGVWVDDVQQPVDDGSGNWRLTGTFYDFDYKIVLV